MCPRVDDSLIRLVEHTYVDNVAAGQNVRWYHCKSNLRAGQVEQPLVRAGMQQLGDELVETIHYRIGYPVSAGRCFLAV